MKNEITRTLSVLLLGGALLSCRAGVAPPSHAHPAEAAASAEAQAPAPAVDGMYVESPSHRPIVVFSFREQKWALVDSSFLALAPAPRGTWVVTFPSGEGLGTFEPPAQPQEVWRLHGDGPAVYTQRRDPVGARIMAALDGGTFRHIETELVVARAELARWATILRDPNPQRFLQEVSENLDPQFIVSHGGVVGWIGQQLDSMLEALRPFAPDPARIDADRATLAKVVAKQGALWSPDEDRALFKIIDATRRSKDTIVTRGPLAVFQEHDKKESCWVGLLVPDFSAPPPAPDAGKSLATRMFAALQVRRDSCDENVDFGKAEPEAGAGVRVFIDRAGLLVGMQVIGYMYSEVYLAEGRPLADALEMLRSSSEELDRQAE